ncbi:hypothetical protein [Haloarcula sp. H-GB5]
MESNTLLQMAPLVQGRLRDQRKEICAGYVEWAVFSEECPTEFEVADIAEILEQETGVRFDEIQIISGLDQLTADDDDNDEEEVYVRHLEGYSYKRVKQKDLDNSDELIDECWDEFKQVLNEHPRDLDTHFVDNNLESAFIKFIDKYVDKLEETTEIVDEANQDVIYTAEFVDLIDNVVAETRLEHPGAFKESLVKYLKDPGENLKKFVGTVYVAIINTDLLEKDDDSIDIPNIPEEERKIFFDSNVIQDLLCESDNEHPLIRNVVERSNGLDFELYYYPETVDDLQRSIDGAIREMSGLKDSNYSSETFENQFLKDWNRRYRELRNKTMEWGEYRSYIQRWTIEVEAQYQIEQFEKPFDLSEEVEFAKDIVDKINSKRNKRPKKPPVLQHDGSILAKTVELRNGVDGRHNIGPLLLTLDNTVTRAADFGYQEGEWPEGIAITPRVWFNYLLTFTSVEFDTSEVGGIILDVSANIDSQPSIENYSKALEEKAGLESNSSELLAKYLRFSAYSDEIENSLRSDDGSADEWAFKALRDEGAMDDFVEHKEQKKRIRKMGQRIQDLEEEKQRLQEEKDNTTEKYYVGGSAEASANAAAVATSKAEIQQELSDFMQLYWEMVPEEVQEEVPAPPDNTSNLEEYQQWLDTALSTINAAESTFAGLGAVSQYGQRILTEIPQFL